MTHQNQTALQLINTIASPELKKYNSFCTADVKLGTGFFNTLVNNGLPVYTVGCYSDVAELMINKNEEIHSHKVVIIELDQGFNLMDTVIDWKTIWLNINKPKAELSTTKFVFITRNPNGINTFANDLGIPDSSIPLIHSLVVA